MVDSVVDSKKNAAPQWRGSMKQNGKTVEVGAVWNGENKYGPYMTFKVSEPLKVGDVVYFNPIKPK